MQTMFNKPVHFHEFLSHHNLIEEVYRSMESSDLAVPVLTVLDILRKTSQLPDLVKEKKSESKSTAFRNEGNVAYGSKKYQKALICYNKALLYAPNLSRAMKLAYSNRSALLHKVNEFTACLCDIETCFSMGCPLEIIDKLRKRKEEAKAALRMEKLFGSKCTPFSEEYFQLNAKRNPQIPCASTDVGVIIENQMPKIVATTDIKVGTLLAVETAFVSITDPKNALFSCYYCHKMNLNLKPCHGCCVALFCNDECRENCLEMYHNTECKIIEIVDTIVTGPVAKLALKAVLKMRILCKTWKELHSESLSMGMKRRTAYSINQIYDRNSKFSLLSFDDERRHFVNGPLYNASFTCAAILHYLDTINGFFPQNQEKGAMITLARLLMFLNLYSTPTQILLCVTVNEQEKTEFHDIENYGWFSFIGKLKNSCTPNILAVGLNKKIGLVALAPIKRGSELTLSHVGHWLDNPFDKDMRNRNMFMLYGYVCSCIVCTGQFRTVSGSLTDMQKKNYSKLNIEEIKERLHVRNVPETFGKLCKTLAFLSDLPYSDEYGDVYSVFRRCVLYLQHLFTENMILDYV